MNSSSLAPGACATPPHTTANKHAATSPSLIFIESLRAKLEYFAV
jgi:hypothetical protein